MIEEKKIRSDKAKNISKVLKEVINNPLASEREIADNTWVSKSSVNRAMQEMGQIGAKSEIILEICDLDINLIKKWLLEINRRFSDTEEIKQINAKDISTIIKESSARYTLFSWEATDSKWWMKTSAVDKLNELLK